MVIPPSHIVRLVSLRNHQNEIELHSSIHQS